MLSPLRLIFMVGVLVIVWVGVYDMLTNFERNACEMTYMFEYPEYIKVPLSKRLSKRFPQYGLYLYGEGKYADYISSFKLEGIPVLFIPGNAGSHKQVRSLGSVALRKAKDKEFGWKFHFNYFSVDFNEELTGLFGGVLQGQTEFVHYCIKHILTLYKNAPNPPKTVILVGHSMGGVVARGLFTLSKFDKESVNTIITQASPHQAPVITLDQYTAEFYKKMNTYWKEHENDTVKDISVFSLGGGYRDILVRTGLTSLKGIVKPDRGLSSHTMATPLGWVSTDHLCIVWCKQIVLATKRAVFDIIDPNTLQVAVNPTYRWKAFHHHWIQNQGSKSFKNVPSDKASLETNIKWEMRKKNSWKLNREQIHATRYSVVEVPKDPEHSFIISSNLQTEAWLVGCTLKPKQEKCVQGTNLVPKANMLPPLYSERRLIMLSPTDLKDFSYLIVVLPKVSSSVEVLAELYNLTARTLHYDITGLISLSKNFNFSWIQHYPASLLSSEVLMNNTEIGACFYNVSLKGLTGPLQAYTAKVEPLTCEKKPVTSFSGTVLKLFVPWSGEHTYSYAKFGESTNLSVKLQSARPTGYMRDAELHVFLHPSCTYRISISTSWQELFGQYLRVYGVILPAFMVVQIFQALAYQLNQLDQGELLDGFSSAHAAWGNFWRVVPFALLLGSTVSGPEIYRYLKLVDIPQDDTMSLSKQGMWSAALPLFLYITAYAITVFHSYAVSFAIFIMSRMYGVLCGRFDQHSGCHKCFVYLQYALLLAACAISITCCGAVGVLISYLVCMVKVIYYAHMKRNQNELVRLKSINKYNIYFTLLLLLMHLLLLNGPSLAVWMKNLQYVLQLSRDPSTYIGITATVTIAIFSYVDFPHIHSWCYEIACILLQVSSVGLLVYAFVSLYRLSYVIGCVFWLLAIPLLFSGKSSSQIPNSDSQEPDNINQQSIEKTVKQD